MLGLLQLFAVSNNVVPQLLIRRYDAKTTFTIFQAANPVLVIVLAALMPVLDKHVLPSVVASHRVRIPLTLALQALAPLIAFAWPTLSGLLTCLVVATVGEAMGMPHIDALVSVILPRDLMPYAFSIGQVPGASMRWVLTALSGRYLSIFCPSDEACKGDRTQWLWLVVALVGLISPLAFVAFEQGRKRWSEARGSLRENLLLLVATTALPIVLYLGFAWL